MNTFGRLGCAPLALAGSLLTVPTLRAQSESPAGVRAAGMAGAFTAVADDGSAVFWNPAGLASASYFSLLIDRNAGQTGVDAGPGQRDSALLFAAGMPALGLSYRRTFLTRVSGALPAALQPNGRDTNGASVGVDSLVTHQAGVTVLQSLRTGIAVGATLKLVHGVAASGAAPAGDTRAALSAGADLPALSSNKFDTDIGIMVSGSGGRLGLAVHNLLEPAFAAPRGAAPLRLQRRVRGGISLNLSQRWRLAGDADLVKSDVAQGRWRDAAIGAEGQLARKVWVRGGTHWNTAGSQSTTGAAPVVSVGGSFRVYGALLVDGQVTGGSRNGDRGWGIGVRLVFF